MRAIFIPALLFLTACATAPTQDPLSAAEGEYVLDPQHASVVWSLSHSGLSMFTGRFDEISGALDFNPEDPAQSVVDIRITSASVSTNVPGFTEELAEDGKYFDSEAYPEIHFLSTSAVTTGAATGQVTGDLTLKGVTKPVTLDVTFNGAGKSFGHPGDTLGFSATVAFERSDFGMDYLTNFGIGDTVKLVIEVEFNEAQ